MDGTTPYTTIERFLDHWDGVRLVTLKLLLCFNDEDLDYRLIPTWRTAGELFHHIGGHQFFVARGVFTKRWDPEPNEPDRNWEQHRMYTTRTVERLHNWLSDIQTRVNKWYREADERTIGEIRDDNPWHKGIRGWLLLHHAYQDELHHRGQLYAIARLLGKTPPEVFAEEDPSYWESRQDH